MMPAAVDWQAYADEILEIVDEQLAAFDLEVVEYDTGAVCTVTAKGGASSSIARRYRPA